MKKKVIVKAISIKNGSICIDNSGKDEWLYVAENVKPYLKDLKKGLAEMDEDGNKPISFIRNVEEFQTAYKKESYGNKEETKDKLASVCVSYAKDIYQAELEAMSRFCEDIDQVKKLITERRQDMYELAQGIFEAIRLLSSGQLIVPIETIKIGGENVNK